MFQKGFKTENKLTREALVRMKLKTKQDLVKECYLVAETTRKKRGNAGDISIVGCSDRTVLLEAKLYYLSAPRDLIISKMSNLRKGL